MIEWEEEMPDKCEVEEILDKARETAGIKSAKFETLQLIDKELI